MKFDFLIVGAGLAGCTLAERIASQLGKKILLVDIRNHIGGNAYDYYNEEGILIQRYGPHIFHTNSKKVWDYLCQFTKWNKYVHRVLSVVNGKEVPFPINIKTMECLYGRRFTSQELKTFFDENRISLSEVKNAKDVVISQIGEKLYELFFKNYTKKQWGVYPEDLEAEVTKRIPVKFNRDTSYFSDKYQGIPLHGFSKMFEKMLDNKNIHMLLKTDYKEIANSVRFDNLIFTGPIDYFFDYKHGKLPYRSLDFSFETLNIKKFQKVGVVNYPNDFDYTRITEFKHFYSQRHHKTTICREYPKSEGDPYYPIPKAEFQEIYQKYKTEADKLKNIYFIGRLAEYKYLNMDQVVENALNLSETIKNGILQT